jgi:anti-sigma regulatory factor (Ser/Thr protein kinase)
VVRVVANTRRVVTIERKGGDRTMDDHGRGLGSRPEGGRDDPPDPAPAPPDPRPYEGVWRFTAAAVDASVPQARHAVRDLLFRQGVPLSDDLLQGLLLIVSELVTNAVKHAALLSPILAVEVAVGAEWLRVSVEDNHPYRPTALVADHDETGGRGLLLVREVTREAGGVCDVEHTASGGKVIWAALPLTRVRVP